jgi:predicted DNA-binding WGR domain protein
MPRYEFNDGSSNKFWEITLNGKSFTTSYGKVGSAGQSTSKSWPSDAEALKQYNKLVAEKEKKGYQLVGGGATTTSSAKPAKATKATKAAAPSAARDAALEQAILNNSEDIAAYEAYGAWLKTQGQPNAELVEIQTALAKKPGDKKLKQREKDFLENNETALWPGLEEFSDKIRASWRYGFVYTLSIGGDEYADEKPADVYAKVFANASTQFIQSLSFWVFDTDDGQPDYNKLMSAIEKQPLPNTLRHLSFDCRSFQISWIDLGKVHKIYPQLQKLETLYIKMGQMDLGAIDLPNLRKLVIETGGFNKANLKSIIDGSLPNLETLILYFGTDNYGCNCKAKDLKALLDKDLPKLKRLGLCNSEFADEIPEVLVGSKLLAQVRHLDLSKGVLSDEGAQVLLDHKKAFVHLDSLDLSENYISDSLSSQLKISYDWINLDGQQDGEDPDDRYVQVSE